MPAGPVPSFRPTTTSFAFPTVVLTSLNVELGFPPAGGHDMLSIRNQAISIADGGVDVGDRALRLVQQSGKVRRFLACERRVGSGRGCLCCSEAYRKKLVSHDALGGDRYDRVGSDEAAERFVDPNPARNFEAGEAGIRTSTTSPASIPATWTFVPLAIPERFENSTSNSACRANASWRLPIMKSPVANETRPAKMKDPTITGLFILTSVLRNEFASRFVFTAL